MEPFVAEPKFVKKKQEISLRNSHEGLSVNAGLEYDVGASVTTLASAQRPSVMS